MLHRELQKQFLASLGDECLCRLRSEDCASALRGAGARVLFAVCDPFCALQACFETVMDETSLFPQRVISINKHHTRR